MSVQVSKLVWAYGPQVASMRLLLLALAEHADDEGTAYPGLPLLAVETLQSERTVLRTVARLEREGWLRVQRRTAGVMCSNGLYERRGATYFVNLAKLRGTGMPNRHGVQASDAAVAKEPNGVPNRHDAEASGAAVAKEPNGVPNRHDAEASGAAVAKEPNGVPNRHGVQAPDAAVAKESNGVPNRHGAEASGAAVANGEMRVENARRDDKMGSPKCQTVQPEMTKQASRDDKRCAPLMNHQEPPLNRHEKYLPPLTPLAADDVCKSNGKGKCADHGQRPEATARATAKATTPSLEAARVQAEGGGKPDMRSRGRVLPFRDQRELDGIDEALRAVACLVLTRCGIAPESTRRRQREAVEAQLRLYCEQHGCAVEDAGRRAVAMWEQYLDESELLFRVVGVARFFADGMWLDSSRWNYDQAAIRERQRRLDGRVGMR